MPFVDINLLIDCNAALFLVFRRVDLLHILLYRYMTLIFSRFRLLDILDTLKIAG